MIFGPNQLPHQCQMCQLADASVNSQPLVLRICVILDYLGRSCMATQVFVSGVSDPIEDRLVGCPKSESLT